MMDLDELKAQWAAQDRKLDESLRLNRQLLRELQLNRAQSAVRRAGWLTGLEVALWLLCLLALGSFGLRGTASAIPAVMAGVYVIGMLHCLIRQLAMAGRIDYAKPIATIQRKVEALRILRIRTTQWAVLIGIVVWAPAAIVVLQGLTGMNLYAGTSGWLWANVAFGLALVPLALWMAKRYGDRIAQSSWGRRLLRDLAGSNLNNATAFLGTLAEFERE